MSNTAIIVIIIAVIVVAAVAVIGYRVATQKRTERLREQFGPEYERALERSGDQRAAESELSQRSKRHEELDLRTLTPDQRAGFERRWTEVQGRFVDEPGDAVRRADRLVVEVMSARGYPVDDFDQRADDLSVSHPRITQRYREARTIATANEDGSASTEDLRRAVTSYRALVEALLDDDTDGAGRQDAGRSEQGRHPDGQVQDRRGGTTPDEPTRERETRA